MHDHELYYSSDARSEPPTSSNTAEQINITSFFFVCMTYELHLYDDERRVCLVCHFTGRALISGSACLLTIIKLCLPKQ